jgi:hypothetical protein
VVGQQLAFELEGGLFGGKQNQRPVFTLLRRDKRPAGVFAERGADFAEAAEGLAAAGRAEEKARLHTGFFTQRRQGGKTFIMAKTDLSGHIFYFLLIPLDYACRLLGKLELNSTTNHRETVCH